MENKEKHIEVSMCFSGLVKDIKKCYNLFINQQK